MGVDIKWALRVFDGCKDDTSRLFIFNHLTQLSMDHAIEFHRHRAPAMMAVFSKYVATENGLGLGGFPRLSSSDEAELLMLLEHGESLALFIRLCHEHPEHLDDASDPA